MSKDFSIVFPSRERPQLITNLLDSIRNMTKELDKIEVLVAIDSDDKDMEKYMQISKYRFVKFFQVERSLNFSRDYYSFLTAQSTGRWVIACNDDAEFMTQGWDEIAKRTLEGYLNGGPNIVYGWIEDMLGKHRLTQFGNYCCFPLLGREGIDALKCFFPDRIPTWGADIWAEKIYNHIGRTVRIPMMIRHISIHNGLRAPDAIYQRIASNQVACEMNPTNDEINSLIAAIKAKRENYAEAR